MTMVGHNGDRSSDIIDGFDPNWGGYDKILDILDFPLDSLDGDDKDWDASNSEDLGPITLDAFMGFYQSNIGNESVNKAPGVNRLVDRAVTVNGASPLRQNVISPDITAFQTPSPISVLERSGTCSSGKILPIRFETPIPVRARSKRGRPSNVSPWFQNTPIVCSVEKKSSNSIKGKKRPTTSELLEGLKCPLQPAINMLPADPNHTETEVAFRQRSVGTKICTHCHVTKTPQWREGPLGKKTLCNACGVRYRSGRLFPEYRPLASPTFSPSLHSNSHRKVIQMRKGTHTEPDLFGPMSS